MNISKFKANENSDAENTMMLDRNIHKNTIKDLLLQNTYRQSFLFDSKIILVLFAKISGLSSLHFELYSYAVGVAHLFSEILFAK